MRSKNCQAASKVCGHVLRAARAASAFPSPARSCRRHSRSTACSPAVDPPRLVDGAMVHPDDDVALGVARMADRQRRAALARRTTSEQVASKPMPATSTPARRRPASTASRTLAQTARQMSSLDCSTMSPGSRNSAMSRLAEPSMLPVASNTPARALPVPTSMPRKCCSSWSGCDHRCPYCSRDRCSAAG